MNYRHAFHAGNFADVLKHVVLCRMLVHLRQKPTAFRIVDTHAGAGLYDLTGEEAVRGGEWQDGIGRLHVARFAPPVEALLAPYRDKVRAHNPGGTLTRYPGSPLLAQAWLRAQDRLIACELESGAMAALGRSLGRDPRCKTLRLDGWTALRAQMPPKERRGIVIIDPPFERPAEFETLAAALGTAHRKWATGILMAWYPVKDRRGPDSLAKDLQRNVSAKTLRIELDTGGWGGAGNPGRLRSCGLIVVNPTWTLECDLAALLPALADCLSGGASAGFRLDWLAREK